MTGSLADLALDSATELPDGRFKLDLVVPG
jgi:hypothetical protein